MRASKWLLLVILAQTASAARSQGLDPVPEKPARAAEPTPVEDAPEPKAARSKVASVTVYPDGALVTREVVVPEGKGPTQLVITPLPTGRPAGVALRRGGGWDPHPEHAISQPRGPRGYPQGRPREGGADPNARRSGRADRRRLAGGGRES